MATDGAGLGPIGGAPRDPGLDGRGGSHVRRVENRYAHTRVHIGLRHCRRCGYRLLEVHQGTLVQVDGARHLTGAVRMCRRCDRDSWLFVSHMPATRRARERDRKVVL